MKLIINKNECWIKDGIELPLNLNLMSDYERWSYIVKNKLFHREDGPAHINSFGTKHWYLNGLSHREDGPAIISPNGTEYWYLNGLCHRENGPAVIYSDGTKAWYLNGLKHRIDGHAFIRSDGSKYWYLNDIQVDGEIYQKIQNSSKEELLVYIINPEYKDYLPLIDRWF